MVEDYIKKAYKQFKDILAKPRIEGDKYTGLAMEQQMYNATDLPYVGFLWAANRYTHEQELEGFERCLKQAASACQDSKEKSQLEILAECPKQVYELARNDIVISRIPKNDRLSVATREMINKLKKK